MIEYKQGNILCEDTEAIINTVNCMGIMGRGIALQFKNIFPENFKAYSKACKNHQIHPGSMFVFEADQAANPRYIINFPTKRHWRALSRMEDVEKGLKDLVRIIHKYNIRSIAIPPLGCGLGGLKWTEIKSRIEDAVQPLSKVRVLIYEPHINDFPTCQVSKAPSMTPGRAVLIELINRYLEGLLDPVITLLEAHKLMYFMQQAGESLKLKYIKYHYGPYAENLRHVFHKIEGHFVSGYMDGGDQPSKPLKLLPGAVGKARSVLQEQTETRLRFDRVAKLIEGFESSFDLELLASVHWVVSHDNALSLSEVVEKIHGWNQNKKKKFTARQINIALDVLSKKGWIPDLMCTIKHKKQLKIKN